MSSLQPLIFRGIDGAECNQFIANLLQRAFDVGRMRDYEYIADLAGTCFRDDALRWYLDLDDDIHADWGRLRRAMLLQYPHDSRQSSEIAALSVIPTPPAAPPIFPPISRSTGLSQVSIEEERSTSPAFPPGLETNITRGRLSKSPIPRPLYLNRIITGAEQCPTETWPASGSADHRRSPSEPSVRGNGFRRSFRASLDLPEQVEVVHPAETPIRSKSAPLKSQSFDTVPGRLSHPGAKLEPPAAWSVIRREEAPYLRPISVHPQLLSSELRQYLAPLAEIGSSQPMIASGVAYSAQEPTVIEERMPSSGMSSSAAGTPISVSPIPAQVPPVDSGPADTLVRSRSSSGSTQPVPKKRSWILRAVDSVVSPKSTGRIRVVSKRGQKFRGYLMRSCDNSTNPKSPGTSCGSIAVGTDVTKAAVVQIAVSSRRQCIHLKDFSDEWHYLGARWFDDNELNLKSFATVTPSSSSGNTAADTYFTGNGYSEMWTLSRGRLVPQLPAANVWQDVSLLLGYYDAGGTRGQSVLHIAPFPTATGGVACLPPIGKGWESVELIFEESVSELFRSADLI